MKKLIIASAITAGLFGASVSHADTVSQMIDTWDERSYAQAKLGFVDLGTSDDGIGVTGTFGMEAPEIYKDLAFEVDVLMTVVDGETTYPSSFGNTKVEASAFGFGGYAVANYRELPVDGLTPFFRLGLAYTSLDVTASNSVASADGEDDSFGLAYGLGLKYDLGNNLEALVGYTDTDVEVFNAGIGYRF